MLKETEVKRWYGSIQESYAEENFEVKNGARYREFTREWYRGQALAFGKVLGLEYEQVEDDLNEAAEQYAEERRAEAI